MSCTVAATMLLVALCGLHTAEAQSNRTSECGIGLTYCGAFCCPNTVNIFQTRCCLDSLSCCAPTPGNDNATIPPLCGTKRCPIDLAPSEVYDEDNLLRNQCCKYFRDGCCSQEENRILDILFKTAIGIGCVIFALLIIIATLVTCCICFFCLS